MCREPWAWGTMMGNMYPVLSDGDTQRMRLKLSHKSGNRQTIHQNKETTNTQEMRAEGGTLA